MNTEIALNWGNIELDKGSMYFKLENGSILVISKQDCDQIAMTVLAAIMVNRECKVVIQKDYILHRINILTQLLEKQKDMPPKLKEKYLEQILALTKQKWENFISADNQKNIEEPLHNN